MTEIIGHRGYAARAPENTLASLELALGAGADSVEWDVQMASCGTPVLIHDATLDRTTDGVGPVRRRSFDQLRLLDAGGWFSPEFEGERIPSLAQALEAVKGRVRGAYCEVKEYRELEDIDRILEVTRRADMTASVTFISLDWRVVERVAERDPAAHIGFVLDDPDRVEEAVARIERLGRGFLDARGELLLSHPSAARLSREAGVELGAWTVNDVAAADRLAARGVTRFTTDEVRRLVEWRDARAPA